MAGAKFLLLDSNVIWIIAQWTLSFHRSLFDSYWRKGAS